MSHFDPLPDNSFSIGGGHFDPMGKPTAVRPYKTDIALNANGFVYEANASTDLHLVADDAGGATWPSRVGSFFAQRTGTPTFGLETPLNPTGGFGAGSRTAIQCTATDFYEVAHDPAHEITSTSTTSQKLTFITGDFIVSEVILCKPIPGDVNFYVAALQGATPYIEVRIRRTITDSFIQFPCSRYTLYTIKYDYNGPAGELTLDVNGVNFASSVGAGDPLVGGALPLLIGTSNTGFGMLTTKLIEYQRDQTIQTTADWLVQFYRFCGLRDAIKGLNPLSFTRASKAAVTVNGKLWQVGENIPRMNDKGYPDESITANVLRNSTFTETLGNGYTIAGAGGVSYLPDVDDNKTVGGTGLNIQNDGLATEKGVYWITAPIGSSVPIWLYLEWKALTVGARAFYQIYNTVTGYYYNALTATWTAIPSYNEAGPTGSGKLTYSLLFNNDTSLAPLFFFLNNGVVADFNSFSFFHANFSPGYNEPQLPFVFEGYDNVSTKSRDSLVYPPSAINYTNGILEASISPLAASTDTISLNNPFAASASLPFFLRPSGSTALRLTDGTQTPEITVPYSRQQELSIKLKWGGSALNITEQISGNTASSTFSSPIGAGNLFLGSDNLGNNSMSYLRSIKIK